MFASERMEHAFQLLRAEYLEMPSVLLGPDEVAELLDLDRPTAKIVLAALEHSGFLRHLPDGRFALAHQPDDAVIHH